MKNLTLITMFTYYIDFYISKEKSFSIYFEFWLQETNHIYNTYYVSYVILSYMLRFIIKNLFCPESSLSGTLL